MQPVGQARPLGYANEGGGGRGGAFAETWRLARPFTCATLTSHAPLNVVHAALGVFARRSKTWGCHCCCCCRCLRCLISVKRCQASQRDSDSVSMCVCVCVSVGVPRVYFAKLMSNLTLSQCCQHLLYVCFCMLSICQSRPNFRACAAALENTCFVSWRR